MNVHFMLQSIRQEIDEAVLRFPELAEDERLRADFFEGETDLHNVLSKLVDVALDAARTSDAIKARKKELDERKARFERKEEACRNIIQSLMEKAGLPQVQLTEATLSTRKVAPSPIVTDEALLPDDCVKIERKPSITAIKAAIEANREVPGVVMSNGRTSLTIRTK